MSTVVAGGHENFCPVIFLERKKTNKKNLISQANIVVNVLIKLLESNIYNTEANTGQETVINHKLILFNKTKKN